MISSMPYSLDEASGTADSSLGLFALGDSGTPKSAGAVYEYDNRNNMIKAVSGSDTTLLKYNGDGLRVEKKVNGNACHYAYEYDKIVLEVNASNSQTARNIYGLNLVKRTAGSDSYSYLYNGHGDVTALLNSGGNVAAQYYYDAFGVITEETAVVNNPFRYAGYEYDSESELYYLKARHYDPTIARFMQEDTYRGSIRDPLSLNLYTYCNNEPIKYYDPTGHVVSAADKQNLTASQQKQVQKYTDDYNAAKAKGDKAGMEAAHAGAEAVRNSAGYSGGTDGSGYTSTTSKNSGSSSTSQLPVNKTPTTVYVPSTISPGGYVAAQGYILNGRTYLMDGSRIQDNTISQVGNTYYRLSNGTGVPTSKPTNVMMSASDAARAGLTANSSANSKTPLRAAGYYTLYDVYGWYTNPDAWEFGQKSDTYKIINDANKRWGSTTDKTTRDLLYSVAEESRRMFREGTPAVFAQGKVEDFLAYMVDEAKRIDKEWMELLKYNPELDFISYKLGIFGGMVKNGGKFDIKTKDEWQYEYEKYHGDQITDTWHRNQAEFMYYDGRLWANEQLGNYTFGYFGAACGYSEEFICFGAGMYQIKSGNSQWGWASSYWDDPRDQANIRMGYQKYYSK